MKIGSRFGFAVAAALLLATSLAGQSASANDTVLAVSNLPEEFVIGDPSALNQDLEIEIFVKSLSDQRVVVEFVDFFFDEQGKRTSVPGGSTPYSLEKALQINSFDSVYDGKGQQQSFLVKLSPKQIEPNLMYAGGINVRLQPIVAGSSSNELSQASSVLSSLIVSPYGIAAKLAEGDLSAAKVTRHDLNRLDRSSFIDSILPDIPGIVNYGAVESVVYFENQGQYPVFTTLNWEFSHSGEVIASRSVPKSILGAGIKAKKSVATQIRGQTDSVLLNVLPAFGIVSNQITLTSTLGGTQLPAQVYDGSFLVLQWKEPFVGVLALYFFVRWAWRRNLSSQQRAQKASLLSLGVQSIWRGLRPKPSVPKVAEPAAAPTGQVSTTTSNLPRKMYIPPGASYPKQYQDSSRR